jgi:hypothetical protein
MGGQPWSGPGLLLLHHAVRHPPDSHRFLIRRVPHTGDPASREAACAATAPGPPVPGAVDARHRSDGRRRSSCWFRRTARRTALQNADRYGQGRQWSPVASSPAAPPCGDGASCAPARSARRWWEQRTGRRTGRPGRGLAGAGGEGGLVPVAELGDDLDLVTVRRFLSRIQRRADGSADAVNGVNDIGPEMISGPMSVQRPHESGLSARAAVRPGTARRG